MSGALSLTAGEGRRVERDFGIAVIEIQKSTPGERSLGNESKIRFSGKQFSDQTTKSAALGIGMSHGELATRSSGRAG